MSSKEQKKQTKYTLSDAAKSAISVVLLSALTASCTKSVPYDQVFKEDVHQKSQIDIKAEYLYVPSTDTSSADSSGASAAQPYWQGKETIVKFKFTEKTLQAVEVVRDDRLKKNALNEKIALEIPISHLEYRCAEDKYKQCKNEEEENNEINWKAKKNFKPDFSGLKTVSVNLVPVEMDKVFGTSCYTETSSQLRKYEITQDAINIQITKTYNADITCLDEKGISVTNLEDLQSQQVFHYSFTKLNKLASNNYQAISYPGRDEGEFGFFSTEDTKLDVDFNQRESAKNLYLNRWNPNKKEIVFYLSDSFNKPEFSSLKKATALAFERFNRGLEQGKLGFRLKLKNPAGKEPGDARNSMIVLVEDPISAGPLGYGPSVVNPRTGEIMSARTVMYYGNLLNSLKFTYDEIVDQARTQDQTKASENLEGASLSAESKESSKASNAFFNKILRPINAKISTDYIQNRSKPRLLSKENEKIGMVSNSKIQLSRSTDKNKLLKSMLVSDKKSVDLDVLSLMSKHCNYPSEYIDFDSAIRTALNQKLGPNLKYWNDLSEKERQAIIDIVAPAIWVPTLIHELGHNMGLRHNFGGSEDKENFYTKEELAKLNVHHEIPYSSVMDYGYSELNLLPTLGKYDIAALRFGYKREVELKDGTVAPVKSTLANMPKSSSELKNYSYCSDEHVEVNPNCKRFDKGTNFLEIVKYMASSYESMYKRRNFRNDRESFSVNGDIAYANARMKNFIYIRAFMERYESVKSRFGISDNDEEWQSIPFLKELKDAAIFSGKFFLNVMTTPDTTCAIAKKDKPNEILAASRLDSFTSDLTSCFDLELSPEFMVVGETGKSFVHKKHPDSPNNYMDQIDVRGIYIDKILAAQFLFDRKIGNSSYDKGEDNYLDIPELTPEITTVLNSILFGSLERSVSFKDSSGQNSFTLDIPVDIATAPTNSKKGTLSHWIPAPLSKDSAKLLGLPDHQVSYQQVLLNIIDSAMKSSQVRSNEDRQFADSYRLIRTNTAYTVDKKNDTITSDIGNLRLIAQQENHISMEVAETYNFIKLLDKLSPEDLKKLLLEEETTSSKMNNTLTQPKLAPEYEKIPKDFAKAYAQGLIDKDLFKYLITILPSSNY